VIESILTPYLTALYFTTTNPKSQPARAFNGQIVLARRETYEFLGGHGAIIRNSVDDVHLAWLAERHRVNYAIVRAPRLCHIRLYRGFKGILRGLERQSIRHHLGGSGRGLLSLLTAALAILWLPILIWLLFDRLWVAAAVFALVPFLALRPWYA